MKEFFYNHPVLFTIGLLCVVLTTFILVAIQIDKYSCKKLGVNVGLETQYHFIGGGCLVKVNGQWTPKDKWINNSGK